MFLAALLLLIVGLLLYLLYIVHDSFKRFMTAESIDAEQDSDLARDLAILKEKHRNLMDAAQLADAQNADPSPHQIYVFAPDPLDLHDNSVYQSTLKWCLRHLPYIDELGGSGRQDSTMAEEAGRSLPCMVFWCRRSEGSPRVIDLVRRLYFDTGKNRNIFLLIHCAKMPDYMYTFDRLIHHFRDGTTRAYVNSRARGVTDVLLELPTDEAIHLAHLSRHWLSRASVGSLPIAELHIPDLNPGSQFLFGQPQKNEISCYNINEDVLAQGETAQIIRGMFDRNKSSVST